MTQPNWNEERMVDRMASGHEGRYPPAFWEFFRAAVEPRLPTAPRIVDLGCGPGLLLQDLSRRQPGASLRGIDWSDAMLARARSLDYAGSPPEFSRHDLNETPLPADDRSADLCVSASVVCFLDNPFAALGEIKRMLDTDGVYLLYDWRALSLPDYIADRGGMDQDLDRLMGLHPYHTRFSIADWRWLLASSGFAIVGEAHPRGNHLAIAGVPR